MSDGHCSKCEKLKELIQRRLDQRPGDCLDYWMEDARKLLRLLAEQQPWPRTFDPTVARDPNI